MYCIKRKWNINIMNMINYGTKKSWWITEQLSWSRENYETMIQKNVDELLTNHFGLHIATVARSTVISSGFPPAQKTLQWSTVLTTTTTTIIIIKIMSTTTTTTTQTKEKLRQLTYSINAILTSILCKWGHEVPIKC